MYKVELRHPVRLAAKNPEEAVKKYQQILADATADQEVLFYVCDHREGSLDSIAHHTEKYEKVFSLTKEQRDNLVETLIHEALSDVDILRQLCEMAARQITDKQTYETWMGGGQ